MINAEYVERRFEAFVSKYASVLRQFEYDEEYVAKQIFNLTNRLATKDFKRYGEAPINDLHGGKRITRFLIKSAIEFCPAQKAKIAWLRNKYARACAAEREVSGTLVFFSFETAYAKELKVPLAPFKTLFYI